VDRGPVEDIAERPPRQVLPSHAGWPEAAVAATSKWRRFVQAMGRVLASEG
jgi:hypothetical protein